MNSLENWLESLGYDGSVGVLHRASEKVRADHPYAREIDLLLRGDGEIGSAAVYEVDRVPAVCFLEPSDTQALDPHFIDEVRRKIWNQNLVSILVVVRGEEASVYPAPRSLPKGATLKLSQASVDGHFSAADVAGGDIHTRLPQWFDRKYRVDRVLQDNLAASVEDLGELGASVEQAQLLLGKCIFVSYLEHRGIVGDVYRKTHKVGHLLELLQAANGKGLDKLFKQLKGDFNGDLLEIEGGFNMPWEALEDDAFRLLAEFLLQTRMRDRQASLWPYDFNYIPVELLSGIYESFLNGEQLEKGAVYTPRHLAALAVSQAFSGSEKPWNEVVLDGACGSGILLTCAFRMMLGAKRASQSRALTYEQRQSILVSGIRGGDISAAACKVTAFSLYLALLEDLAPSDIARLQEDQNVKLPPLMGTVLTEEGKGDFFSADNHIAKPGSATIVISNPPWFEPKTKPGEQRSVMPYEAWWLKRFKQSLPRLQIALAFARRATDALAPGGKLCLILPANVLAAADSGPYLQSWFREMAPQRIFNLSDMRFVLFEGADHPTAVVIGSRRPANEVGRIPVQERFEYLVPKADVSLAFGRLTAHSVDRKHLLTHAVVDDAELFRTYFWGTALDESLIARLRMLGTFEDLAGRKDSRFVICKGFHMTDKHKDAVTSKPLHKYRYLNLSREGRKYPSDRFFIAADDLEPFPAKNIPTVADYGSWESQAFDGVRVIFPDGTATSTLEVRACYTDEPMCFTQTVGAIVDRQGNQELMQFTAAYLRSKLARYLLFYTAFSLTHERPHVKLAEIKKLPFLTPEEHPDPERAAKIMHKVSTLLQSSRNIRQVEGNAEWKAMRDKLEELVFDYFDLSATERQVVSETCDYLIPSRQPHSLKAMSRPLQSPPQATEFTRYVNLLRSELDIWRKRFKGEGEFEVELIKPSSARAGAVGIVRIGIGDGSRAPLSTKAMNDVEQILEQLRGLDEYPRVGDETLSMASDFMLFYKGDYFFVKPLVRRLWLASAAAHDALQIVRTVRAAGAVQ